MLLKTAAPDSVQTLIEAMQQTTVEKKPTPNKVGLFVYDQD
jgi:hypothetical protein